ncbi:aspartate aminotransferase family protein [Glycomyces albidus]|uniref:Aminotransferase class III-fold pyridoxal phosphate-dependent enzyme n=1 Tax=Glycomyces albidus TaxID=2656774 RepID=A0A6L5G786_9ACTN|nr:aminotransferase class III-fold pyridoxal phosphate-dependent enzyme [Glycomyces albidus]MQM25505.1 aminotransferase class III-fold pyridoxal phosphate-dependent enzyme [Glycomyces albidus]
MRLIDIDEAEAMDLKEVQKLYRRYINSSQVSLMTSFGFGRDLVARAEGCYLHLKDGRRITDLTGGVGVLNHGHNHPRILEARRRFAERGRMEVHKTFFSPYLAALSHNLAEVLPEDLDHSFFPNSGAEAIEGAVKCAYKYHGGKRNTVLRATSAFHGKLLGSGGLTAAQGHGFRFPTIPGIDDFVYDDLESVERAVAAHPGDVYALLVEPFSASTMGQCSEEFLQGLRALCDREDIVLIYDEIYTGWGKTGSLFHFMRHEGAVPDILCTSKALGGGKSSISGFVVRNRIYRRAYDNLGDALLQTTSTTYYGFGEECATAIEAVKIAIEDDYPARARAIEAVLSPGLDRIAKAFPDEVADVRGAGALWGLFLQGRPSLVETLVKLVPGGLAKDPGFRQKLLSSAFLQAMYEDHGIYLYYTLNGEHPVVIGPPLVTPLDEVHRCLAAIEETLSAGLGRLVRRFVAQKVSSLW